MTDTYTIDTLSKMTMVEIMNQMNHYRELSISIHNDKIKLIKKNRRLVNERKELKNKQYKKVSSKGLVKTKRLLETQRELMFNRAVMMASEVFVYEDCDGVEGLLCAFNNFFDPNDKLYYKEMYEYFKIAEIISVHTN